MLVEKTTATHCRKAHVRGPEVYRLSPDLYDSNQPDRLQVIAEESPPYFVSIRLAVYFIAGNWKEETDWTKMQPWYKPDSRS